MTTYTKEYWAVEVKLDGESAWVNDSVHTFLEQAQDKVLKTSPAVKKAMSFRIIHVKVEETRTVLNETK